MKRLGQHRKSVISGLLALGALITLVAIFVVPALATTAGAAIPPASVLQGVTPKDAAIGGQPDSTICSFFYQGSGSKPLYAYGISNPKSGTYTTTVGPNSTTVTFTLTMNPQNTGLPAYAKDKYVSVSSSTGAAIVDIGVNGGTDTAHYDYSSKGFVTADTYLHAPAQSVDSSGNPTSLFSVSHLTFCFNLGGTVSGTVFNDVSNNGSKDPGDSGQQGWTVRLYKSSTLAQTTTSDSAGAYRFADVTVGATYSVCVVGQSGWRQTLPTAPTAGSTPCATETNLGYAFTMDRPKTALDFGNVQLQSISGTAFVDTDGSGGQNGAETGQSGLTVTLYDASNTSLGSTTTASTPAEKVGTYEFTNLVVGATYKVCISKPSPGGSIETKPASGASCTGTGQSAVGYSFTLASIGRTGLDFGHEPIGSVSGTVYQDANQNGQNDAGDTPQPGWTVNLYTSSTLTATTTSGAGGGYSFNLLLSTGTPYRICEAPPSTPRIIWAQSQPQPTTPNICTGTSELNKGYSFQPSSSMADITANDLGNVPAVNQPTCPPSAPFGLDNYKIQLAGCKLGQTFVFAATPGVIDGNTSTPPPSVSVWVGDATQAPVPLVEKITFPFTITDPGTPQPLLTLYYDDLFPFSQARAAAMPFCYLDPRVATSEFDLQQAYSTVGGAASVLPGTTSCLILQSQSATRIAAGQGTYTAFVYSTLDGLRFAGP